jgi:siderophore synthetase component
MLRWPARELAHSLQSAVVAGHFRHFAGIATEHLGVPELEFWQLVRAEIVAWHSRLPDLADRIAAFDLLAPTFGRVALNWEQLNGCGFHDRSDRDAEFDLMHGSVPNPLAP